MAFHRCGESLKYLPVNLDSVRLWSILMLVVSAAVAVPVLGVLVPPTFTVKAQLNIPDVNSLLPPPEALNYTASPLNMPVIGDFYWGFTMFTRVLSTMISGVSLPLSILAQLGAPPWLLALATAIVSYAVFKAVVYMVSSRTVDAV